jgi:hypothetical protein
MNIHKSSTFATTTPGVIEDCDSALTRPWSVDKIFRRNPNPRPRRSEASCSEGNANIVIGRENYFRSADGLLMPAKKNQPPPDLRYFKQQPQK